MCRLSVLRRIGALSCLAFAVVTNWAVPRPSAAQCLGCLPPPAFQMTLADRSGGPACAIQGVVYGIPTLTITVTSNNCYNVAYDGYGSGGSNSITARGTYEIVSGSNITLQPFVCLSTMSWSNWSLVSCGPGSCDYHGQATFSFNLSGGTLPSGLTITGAGFLNFSSTAPCVSQIQDVGIGFGLGLNGLGCDFGEIDHHFQFVPSIGGLAQESPLLPVDTALSSDGATVYQFATLPLAPSACLRGPASSSQWISPPPDTAFRDSSLRYAMTDASTFTGIADFPSGFSSPFRVDVGPASLGTFSSGDSLRFVDYAAQLGDSLIGGRGVRSFVVSNIVPTSIPPGGRDFPLQIAIADTEGTLAVTTPPATVTGVALGGRRSVGMHSVEAIPNPFQNRSTLRYTLSHDAGPVVVMITDVAGRAVRRFMFLQQPAGAHEAVWDGRRENGQPVQPGLYFYRIRSGSESIGGCITRLH